jgi:UDP-glucose 4-epimerase
MEADGYDVAGTENFMSVCFCCTCCCINGRVMQKLSTSITAIYQKMEGLTVEVDQETCTGCEDCMEVCVFAGMEMIDEKAKVNQKRCLGCGRCASTCPNDAISIEFNDIRRVDELIEKLEAHVDVS